MSDASTTAGLDLRPGSQADQDRPAVPPFIAHVLYVVGILEEYGRHLLYTLDRRAASRTFSTIAQFFGTATVATIRTRLECGVLRAFALRQMLELRAAKGRDLRVPGPRSYGSRAAKRADPAPTDALPGGAVTTDPPPTDLPAIDPPSTNLPAIDSLTAAQPGGVQSALGAASRVRRPTLYEQLRYSDRPTIMEIRAQVARRPIGSTLVDICRDFGVSPSLCEGSFWDRISTIIYHFHGSFNNIVLEMNRREKRFERDVMSRLRDYDWPEQSNEGVRRTLGFLIGEPPADPTRPATTASVPSGTVAAAAAAHAASESVAAAAPAAIPAAAPDAPVAVTATGPP